MVGGADNAISDGCSTMDGMGGVGYRAPPVLTRLPGALQLDDDLDDKRWR